MSLQLPPFDPHFDPKVHNKYFVRYGLLHATTKDVYFGCVSTAKHKLKSGQNIYMGCSLVKQTIKMGQSFFFENNCKKKQSHLDFTADILHLGIMRNFVQEVM